MKLVSVVIPIYKVTLDKDEIISLKQCYKILKKHPITFVQPKGLNHENYTQFANRENQLNFEEFEIGYFNNIEGYNNLLLSKNFYGRFTNYKYILIYQLDAFVFKDELEYWCNKGYAYIGAPWPVFFLKQLVQNLKDYIPDELIKKSGIHPIKNMLVGNGGFSLRNVSAHFELLKSSNIDTSKYTLNEDVFISLILASINKEFSVAPQEIAMYFAWEMEPEEFYKRSKKVLPFGCHAWNKAIGFWEEHIFRKTLLKRVYLNWKRLFY